MLIDTHCHLDLPQFDADRAEVVARAEQAGVRCIIVPGIDLASCRRALSLADQHAGVYAAVGVHPNESGDFDDSTAAELRTLARHAKVVAVGEIGLDYYWKRVAPDRQKQALRTQLSLAAELGLPVILHSREANADLLWELTQWGPDIRNGAGRNAMLGVWHAFSGNLADAQAAYGLGLVLSLGGPVTFQNARQLQALVPQLLPECLMLETDAPYLAPHPYRGKRNEPGFLPLIQQALADLMRIEKDSLARQSTDTATRLFKLPA